ncbi:MAG: hypothetical protein J0L88_10295 [Xanthomonadales bacterium]|nr:hypothetical protein [Xanthomonadales bacterium]
MRTEALHARVLAVLRRCCIVLVLSTALGGCEVTRFESLPGDHVERCDARWVGNWRLAADDDDDANDLAYVSVNSDCSGIRTVENGKVADSPEVKLQFARVGRMNIVAVLLADQKSVSKEDPGRSPGFHYFRYEAGRDRISLHAVDDRRVADLIINGKLRGSVKFDSQGPQGRKPPHGSTLENFVAGDTAAMARAVQQRGVFDRRSHVRLIRVDSIPMSPPSTTPETPP